MAKTRITIYLTVAEAGFTSNGQYTRDDVLAFETAIEDALDSSMTDYDTVVHITMAPNDGPTEICGLDLTDPQDDAVHSLISARLNDCDFMNAAWEKAWR